MRRHAGSFLIPQLICVTGIVNAFAGLGMPRRITLGDGLPSVRSSPAVNIDDFAAFGEATRGILAAAGGAPVDKLDSFN